MQAQLMNHASNRLIYHLIGIQLCRCRRLDSVFELLDECLDLVLGAIYLAEDGY